MINLERFKEIELKTAKVLEAEKVKGSEKLLKLQVEMGSEKRQIIAGIGLKYQPQDLIGKIIIIVANLEPKKFRIRQGEGEEFEELESQGMLLAASDPQKGPVLLTTDEEVDSGLGIS
ncbi:MAG: hypothetical protein KatS3mg098_035 [Candidatus Parcubacteria bacterium]|nr:methionine--tRNA ligase [Patescibacteria group bacterium]BCX15806.1 MAG: hypothetical protein KatS3mg098_035 [Candidatus Parcubacteria bacterium]